jgi:hypothetical protein
MRFYDLQLTIRKKFDWCGLITVSNVLLHTRTKGVYSSLRVDMRVASSVALTIRFRSALERYLTFVEVLGFTI